MSLAFHLLSGGEHEQQGFFGHVLGGMGAISGAIASAGRAAGMQIATGAAVARILVRRGRAAGSWPTCAGSGDSEGGGGEQARS